VVVRHGGTLAVGPGSVNPTTGALSLGASDVSIGDGQGALSVGRSYSSRQLTSGQGGPLGPIWKLNVGGAEEIEVQEGAVTLVSGTQRTTFLSDGKGGFLAPKGDDNLLLEVEKVSEKVVAYLLKDPAAGTTVRFTQPKGAVSTSPWLASSSEGALSKQNGEKTVTTWESLEVEGVRIDEPRLALAPTPAGVTCSTEAIKASELSKGCRGLLFAYATSTTASGEAPGEWGAYDGRLKQVLFAAYNPATKAMEEKLVAEYSYDKQGRLRAEWDPRTASLKTSYGYDAEGHVVAVSPPGQEPVLLHYGSTSADPGPGRLLSVIRPPAGSQSELESAEKLPAPTDTTVPALSNTSPLIGTTLSISSNGSWSNSPLAYSYSWEDCFTRESKEACSLIPGAVNQSYTPQARDAGYTLKGQVTAINASGAGVAVTAASKAIAVTGPAYYAKFGEKGEGEKGQLNAPAATAVDSSGNVWVVDRGNNRVQEWSATGTWLHSYGAKGSGALQFEAPEGIAINTISGSPSFGDIYVVDKGNSRIEELNAKGEYVRSFGVKGIQPGDLKAPEGIAIEAAGDVWVGDTGNNRIDEFTETGEALGSFGTEGSGNGQLKAPDGIAFSGGDAFVVDSGNDRVQEFSLSGEYLAQFGSKGSGSGQLEAPAAVATEPISGDLYVADSANNRIDEFNPAGVYLLSFGKKGEGTGEFSTPTGVAVNQAGDVYVADTANNRVQEFEPKYSRSNPAPEPPTVGSSAITSIDYEVPVSGSGAPHELSSTELEKWGQLDKPVEATAVFPPVEPMGWPAKNYTSATVTYLDEFGRTVNRGAPTGGVATSEYNEDNEVTRSLSADNRALALKESKPAEVAARLDTKSTYSKEGRLEGTVGPQHLIKLSTGAEKQARNHVKYFYDEGAPSGETYDLVTKTVDGAEYEGKETDVRSTNTSYSGQKNLGWLLRKATSVTTDPVNGLKGTFQASFGSVGSENGQLQKPHGIAINASGDIYVVDNNSRVQEFSPAGEYIRKFATEGTGSGQLKRPEGIAISSSGTVYVADTGNHRIEEFSETGEYLATFGQETLSAPNSLALSPAGNVYVLDGAASTGAVKEFSAAGKYIREFGEEGKGVSCERNYQVRAAQGIAVSAAGNVYVASTGCDWIVEFSETGVGIRDFGEVGNGNGQFIEPKGVAVAANGDVYVADTGNSRIQEFSEGGKFLSRFGVLGSENGQLKEETGLVVAANSEVYVADTRNNRIERFGGFSSGANLTHTTVYDPTTGKVLETRSPEAGEGEPAGSAGYAFKKAVGSEGTGSEQLKEPLGVAVASTGTVYVADYRNDRVMVLSPTGVFLSQIGKKGAGNGEFGESGPHAVAVAPNGNLYVTDPSHARVQEFSATGEYLTKFGKAGSGNGEFSEMGGIAVAPSGSVYVADKGNHRVEVFTAAGEYKEQFGALGSGNGQFKAGPEGLAVAANGNVYAVDPGNDRVEKFTATGGYLEQFGEEGNKGIEFHAPFGVAVNASGDVFVADASLDRVQEVSPTGTSLGTFGSEGSGSGQFKGAIGVGAGTNGELYVSDNSNDRLQIWTPQYSAGVNKTIYYTTATNSEYPECGGHPEWAELPCQSQPAVQPGTAGLPELPVVTDESYNLLDEPETITEKFGASSRTKITAYDTAGRIKSSEETASGTSDTNVPSVSDTYSATLGILTKQTAGSETVESSYNTLGELSSYTDATGAKTSYAYTVQGQVEEMNYEINKTRYEQTYKYEPSTGELSSLVDSTAKTFTAAYDAEGRMTSETYPNGMTAKYSLNQAGETTGLEYEKTSHCTTSCTWYAENLVPSIHGEALTRSSTLASETYGYDNAGRLTQVQEALTGQPCATRAYAYNENSDRTGLTSYAAGSKGECQTTTGKPEGHSYDSADRLTDSGVSYEAFGDMTNVPAADAGEHELTASFYIDGQTHTQTQNGEKMTYTIDPVGRTREVVAAGTTNSTSVNHYPGAGEAVSWTSEAAEQWTRDIPGIDGTLTATQHSGEEPVLLLHDLEGNVVAKAALSETETKLLSTYNSTEFGVPVNGTPPKYSWLGATGLQTELASGATASGGASYVPQVGQSLQTEPISPPAAIQSIVGPYTSIVSSESTSEGTAYGADAPAREATRQATIRKEQEEAEARWREGHYTPPGVTPTPEGGGAVEEEGSATGGDPVACSWKAKAQNEEGFSSTHMNLDVTLVCDEWVPGLQFQACLQELEGGTSVYNDCRTPLNGQGSHWRGQASITIECNEGRYYRGWLWWWWPELGHKHGFQGTVRPLKCEQSGKSVLEEKVP